MAPIVWKSRLEDYAVSKYFRQIGILSKYGFATGRAVRTCMQELPLKEQVLIFILEVGKLSRYA